MAGANRVLGTPCNLSVAACREQGIGRLAGFDGPITIVPGAAADPDVVQRAVAGCGGVLVGLAPVTASAPRRRADEPFRTRRRQTGTAHPA